jgi:hypothetical protein
VQQAQNVSAMMLLRVIFKFYLHSMFSFESGYASIGHHCKNKNIVRKLSRQIKDRSMRLLITSILLTICFNAIGQTFPTKKALTFYPGTYIDSEYRYTDSTGIVVIIQNSLRKGGKYTDPTGKDFFSAIYWYRVINETDNPIEMTINFPADSFTTLNSSGSYLKVFLPPDTMKLEKEGLYAYGATGLKSFLDTGLVKPTVLQRTINSKDACLFYIGALVYQGFDIERPELVLKGKNLFYKIGGIEIPCGQIVFKK